MVTSCSSKSSSSILAVEKHRADDDDDEEVTTAVVGGKRTTNMESLPATPAAAFPNVLVTQRDRIHVEMAIRLAFC